MTESLPFDICASRKNANRLAGDHLACENQLKPIYPFLTERAIAHLNYRTGDFSRIAHELNTVRILRLGRDLPCLFVHDPDHEFASSLAASKQNEHFLHRAAKRKGRVLI